MEPRQPQAHPTNAELGQEFARIRESLGLDVETFAAQAGLDASIVVELESGRRTWVQDDLEAFSRALDVPLSQIFRSCEQPNV